MKRNQSTVFTLMVDNEFGVLTRITALIRRAGWNIRSLAVAETEATEVSRLTICIECKNNTIEYVLEKLGKQGCVREISSFSPETQVAQELALLRVKREALPKLDALRGEAEIKTLTEDKDDLTLAVTCEPERMDALLRDLHGSVLLEFARTGTIAIKRPQKEDK